MRKVNIILFLVFTANFLFGHEPGVHQYIVREAYKLLKYHFPEIEAQNMNGWIGTDETDYLRNVVSGAYNEDSQDIIYMECGWNFLTGCVLVSNTHFWSADHGDNWEFVVSGDRYKNALEKAKHMWYGTHHYYFGYGHPVRYIEKKRHYGLVNLYHTGNYFVYGYYELDGQYWAENKSYTYTVIYRRKDAYSTLGRMCHLLGDMSVPAHVHGDAHPTGLYGGKDRYEQDMEGLAGHYNWQHALTQGGLLMDVLDKEYPIRYLFYVMNQYADFFPSIGIMPGADTYYGDDNYINYYTYNGHTDYYPILDDIFDNLGTPPLSVNSSAQANHLMPMVIRATASLLYYFAIETGQLIPPSTNPTTSGPMASNEYWISSVSLTGDVYVPDNMVLLIGKNASIDMNGYSIISSGGNIINYSANISGLRATAINDFYSLKGLFSKIQTACNNTHLGTIWLESGTFQESIMVDNPPGPVNIKGDINGSGTNIGHIIVRNTSSSVVITDVNVMHDVYLYNNFQTEFRYVKVYPDGYYTDALVNVFNSGLGSWPSSVTFDHVDVWYNPDEIGVMFYNSKGSSYNSQYAYHDIAFALSAGSNFHFVDEDDLGEELSWYLKNQFCENGTNISTGSNCSWSGSYGSTCDYLRKVSPAANQGENESSRYTNEMPEKVLIEEIDKLKTHIRNDPSSESKADLRILVNLYKRYDMDAMGYYLQEIIEDEKFIELKSLAKRHMIDYYNFKNERDKSLDIADEILNETSDESIICETLFETAMIYRDGYKDKDAAITELKTISENYPKNPIAIFAKKELSLLGVTFENKPDDELSQPDNFILMDNYPNPFNPTTTITYSLPEASHVRLTVYDYLGQQIAVLVDDFIEVGTHSVIFNGSNLSSGIYFYRITAGDFTQENRMALIK